MDVEADTLVEKLVPVGVGGKYCRGALWQVVCCLLWNEWEIVQWPTFKSEITLHATVNAEFGFCLYVLL